MFSNSTVALLASPAAPSPFMAPAGGPIPATAPSPDLPAIQQAALLIAPLGGSLIDLTAGSWQVITFTTLHMKVVSAMNGPLMISVLLPFENETGLGHMHNCAFAAASL